MKSRSFVFILILIQLAFVGWIHYSTKGHAESSLRIIYRNPVPPDSIKQFLSVCFQLNKTDLISDADQRSLVQARMSAVSKEWIGNGRIKELSNEADRTKFNEEIWRPFKNNLLLRFFTDTIATNGYRIDSIQWQVVTLIELIKGDTLKFQTLLPEPGQLDMPYVLVKNLADKVVTSGLIK